MPKHKVYKSIIKAIKEGRLVEPFSTNDFRDACSGLGNGTYRAFLYKHRKGNPYGNTELFELVDKNKFKTIKPFKYNLDC